MWIYWCGDFYIWFYCCDSIFNNLCCQSICAGKCGACIDNDTIDKMCCSVEIIQSNNVCNKYIEKLILNDSKCFKEFLMRAPI